MEIVLLRHGETDWNRQGRCQGISDLELNSSGLKQAQEIASTLRHEPLQAIYSSHMRRAIQTAESIRQYHASLAIVVDNDFRELDHGHLEGLTFEEIRQKYPEFIGRWRVAAANLMIPGGETIADVDQRTWDALQRVAQRHSVGTAVVITHNFPILATLCRITKTDLNNYRAFHVGPGTLTRISYEKDRGWRLL